MCHFTRFRAHAKVVSGRIEETAAFYKVERIAMVEMVASTLANVPFSISATFSLALSPRFHCVVWPPLSFSTICPLGLSAIEGGGVMARRVQRVYR